MKVWVWGGNTEGQLGLGEEAPETVFTPNQLLLQDEVNNQSCMVNGHLVLDCIAHSMYIVQ